MMEGCEGPKLGAWAFVIVRRSGDVSFTKKA